MTTTQIMLLLMDRVLAAFFFIMIVTDLRDGSLPRNRKAWARYAVGLLFLGCAVATSMGFLWMLGRGIRYSLPDVFGSLRMTWREAFPKRVTIPEARVLSEDREAR